MLRNLQFKPLKQELQEKIKLLQESTTALMQSTSLQQTPVDFTSLSEKQRQRNVQEHKTLPELEQSLAAHESLFRLLNGIFSPQYLEKPTIEITVDEKLELGLRFFRQLDPDLLTLIDKFVQLESDPLPEVLAPIDIFFQDGGVHVSEVDISETVPNDVQDSLPVQSFDLIEADSNKNDEVDHDYGWGGFFGSDANSFDDESKLNESSSMIDKELGTDEINNNETPVSDLIKPQNYEELWLLLEAEILPGITNADIKWQAHLQRATNLEDLTLSIANFIFEKHQSAVNDKNELTKKVKILVGDPEFFDDTHKVESQKLVREFLEFIALPDENHIQTVLDFPLLTGGIKKEELIAAIKTNLRVEDLTENKKARSDENTLKQIEILESKLGLTLKEMAAHAQLKDPEQFYAEPLSRINAAIKDRSNIVVLEKEISLSHDQRKVILARDLFKTVWQENYSYKNEQKQQKGIFNIFKSKENDREAIVQILPERIVCDFKQGEKTLLKISCDYVNGAWQEAAVEFTAPLFTEDPAKILDPFNRNQAWFEILLAAHDSSSLNLLSSMDQFITSRDEYKALSSQEKRASYKARIYAILCGDEAVIEADKDRNQQIFRDWINHLEKQEKIKLNDAIAEFPKLTGVRNFDELKILTDKKYPETKLIKLGFDIKDPAKSRKKLNEIVKTIVLQEAGLDIDAIKEWPGYQTIENHYSAGFMTEKMARIASVWTNIQKDSDSISELITLITTFELFPQYAENLKASLIVPGKNDMALELTIEKNAFEVLIYHTGTGSSKLQYQSNSCFDDNKKSWINQVYNSFFVLTENTVRANKKLFEKFLEIIESSEKIPRSSARLVHRKLRNDFYDFKYPNKEAIFNIKLPNGDFSCSGEFIAELAKLNRAIWGEIPNPKDDPKSQLSQLKEFIRFAARTYPGFAEMDNDESLREILGLENEKLTESTETPVIDQASAEKAIAAIMVIKMQGRKFWETNVLNQLNKEVECFKQQLERLSIEIEVPQLLKALSFSENHFTEILPNGFSSLGRSVGSPLTSISLDLEYAQICSIINKIFEEEPPAFLIHLKAERYKIFTDGVGYCQINKAGEEASDKPLSQLGLVNGEWKIG